MKIRDLFGRKAVELKDYKKFLQESPNNDSKQFAEIISLLGLPIEKWKTEILWSWDRSCEWWNSNRWKTPKGVGLAFYHGQEYDRTTLNIGKSFLGSKTTTDYRYETGRFLGTEEGYSSSYPNSSFHPVFASGKRVEFDRTWSKYGTIYYKDLESHKFAVRCESIVTGGDGRHYYSGVFLDSKPGNEFGINGVWAKKIFCLCSGLDYELWHKNNDDFKKKVEIDLNDGLTKTLEKQFNQYQGYRI